LGITQWKAWAKNHAENLFSLFSKNKISAPFVEEKFCFITGFLLAGVPSANKNYKWMLDAFGISCWKDDGDIASGSR
jgi:hypothetical protein